VRRARLDDALGSVGSENVQGETQQKLDVIAHEVLPRTLGGRAGGVGTIFSILRDDQSAARPEDSLLQPGSRQVAAGYVLYGSSTVFVLTLGEGADMFVLDTAIGAFVRVAEGLRMPAAARSYSVNDGNRRTFPAGYQRCLDWAQERGYSSRYAGAMVADLHRIVLKGGVFMYPPTALLVEQASGRAPALQAAPYLRNQASMSAQAAFAASAL